MQKMKLSLFLLCGVAFFCSQINAMVFDNRFLPLLQRPRFDLNGTHSTFATDFKAATASDAFSQGDRSMGIPEMFGELDLGVLSDAIDKTGLVSPLRPDWKGKKIFFRSEGKVQMQALSFFFHQRLLNWLHVGASWAYFRTNSRQNFKLNMDSGKTNLVLTSADVLELEQDRMEMLDLLGIDSGHTAQLGFGDIDFWFRLGHVWDYTLKFRSIDSGFRVGMLVPTGQRRCENKSPSIPHGGNGHWGIYGTAETLFEVKEDMKVGVSLRVSKRFANTTKRRIPVLEEPDLFGALYGSVKVDPGLTVVFSPYVLLENLREGLALCVQYTLRAHGQDSWHDMRADKEIPANFCELEKHSGWASDYFSLNVIYDFGRVRVLRDLAPALSFRWDVPSRLFVSKHVAKTHQVSLGLKFVF